MLSLFVLGVLAMPTSLTHRPEQFKGNFGVLAQLALAKQNGSQDAGSEVLAMIQSFRQEITDQAQLNERRSSAAQAVLVVEAGRIDAHLTTLNQELVVLKQQYNNTVDRLRDINNRLLGSDVGQEEIGVGDINQSHPENGSPDSLPSAGDGSVLQVLRVVWSQLITLHEACQADAPIHSQRAGPRLDVEAINYILKDMSSRADVSDIDIGCPFCNQTFCRQVIQSCLIEAPDASVPLQLQPDTATCWLTIDSYCKALPGANDPGCGCRAAERCWDDAGYVGRCPVRGKDGSRVCDSLPELQCRDFFNADISRLFESPTYSAADEVLVSNLRELRHKLLATPPTTESTADHCSTDQAALLKHFQKIQAIVSTLLKRRADVILSLNALEKMIQSESGMIEAAETTKQEILTRMAMETQALIERRQETQQQLQSLDELIGVLGGVVGKAPQEVSNVVSSEGALRSCLEIKKHHPELPSGVYWVTLGKTDGTATRVYCDMTTDGGGWTLIWKNVGGAASESARLQHANNAELLASSREDVVTTPYMERRAQFHRAAFDYFAARPNQQWMKQMVLFRGSTDATHSQRVIAEMGHAKLKDVFAAAPGCSPISDQAIKLYSSRANDPNGATDYYMGQTRTVINRKGESFGLASAGTPEDMCLPEGASPLTFPCDAIDGKLSSNGQYGEPLVCDYSMLRRLGPTGALTEAGSWELVRHLFSYMHNSPSPREANRCMYRCWEPTDDALYNDVFVWAVRGKCPEGNGQECSLHGNCDDGICTCNSGFVGEACEQRISCGNLPQAQSGSNLTVACSGNKFQDTCTFSCPVGYVLSGSPFSECHANGSWTQNTPQCVPRSCGTFDIATVGTHAVVECSGTALDDSCSISCELGYRLNASGNGVKCSALGTWNWNGDVSTCKPILCDVLSTPEHGTQSCNGNPSALGTTCVFGCLQGFVLEGATSVTCSSTGSYSGSTPSCLPLECQPYEAYADVIVDCNTTRPTLGFPQGHLCSFSCAANYALHGAHLATCTSGGTWTIDNPVAPHCEVIDKCLDVVCPATLPVCESGSYVAPRASWGTCCFDPLTDCRQFEEYVVLSLELPIEVSSTSGEGITNKNAIRSVIATISNVRASDVDVLNAERLPSSTGTTSIISLAVISSADETKEHNLDTIITSLEDSLTANPGKFVVALQTAGIEIPSFGVIARPVRAMRVPTDIPHNFEFTDTDGRQGWLEGDVTVHKTFPVDRGCTRYLVYFGDGQGSSKSNRVGDVVATINVNAASDTPFVVTHIPTTQVPSLAREWLVFSGGPYAEAANGLRSPLKLLVREPPVVPVSTVTFHDQDERTGFIKGNVVITDATPITGATHYVVYFGNGGTGQLNKIGASIAEAAIKFPTTSVSIPSPVAVPEGATHIIVFSRNVDIESDHGVTSALQNLPPNHHHHHHHKSA